MSISALGAPNPALTAITPKAGDADEKPVVARKAALPDGILDGAVYGALATILLGPLVSVRASNPALAAVGTLAANVALFATLDAVLTDNKPEALDQYLKF